jgi:hypothetical protein
MAEKVTSADLDQAEADLREAKNARVAGDLSTEEYRERANQAVATRRTHRLQEEAAGNRIGHIGGDAFVIGVDCPRCDLVSIPPDELRTHLLVEHGGKG